MKNITEFVFTDGKGFFLSLEDKELALTVSPNDGDLDFHEGEGPDRWNEHYVPGRYVEEFEVDRVQGMLGVVVRFKKAWGANRRLLGFTKDEENAKAWVERVNKVYYVKRQFLELRAEGFRLGEFRCYPAVHDILADGNIVLPGDYAQSTKRYPVPVFRPSWQECYVDRSIFYLKEETGFAGQIETYWQNPPEHRYPHLADRIKYLPKTSAEYQGRVTQPLELIFDCGQRRDKIAVIPLAKATYFALIYVRGQVPESHLGLRSEEFADRSLEEWLSKLSQPLHSRAKLVVCTPSDTSVDYMFEELEFNGRIEKGQRASMPTIPSLAFWLFHFYPDGVIACDVGIAYQLLHHWKASSYPHDLKLSFLWYNAVIPVGMAYRRDDPKWGGICHSALAECIFSDDANVQESLYETKELTKPLGLEWMLQTN